MVLDPKFWNGKTVFITGHTGFKGSWMSLWLSSLGAKVFGYSLEPPTNPSLFKILNLEEKLHGSVLGDVRDLDNLTKQIGKIQPEILIHMAAQPLVRDSYKNPVDTYSTNVMGTVNVLEAVRLVGQSVRVLLNITTDKVYENKEWVWAYRENERLGGYDPYSNSKSCSELVTSAYVNSFFHPEQYGKHNLNIATVRAGNVIGGGDFATDRLIPDIIRSISEKETVRIRNPNAIRPWQHVLEPIGGYLRLVERMFLSSASYNGSWNFGPNESDAKSVLEIVEMLRLIISRQYKAETLSKLTVPEFVLDTGDHPHEANFLKLDISKAKSSLGWNPRWSLETALIKIVEWTNSYLSGESIETVCLNQIKEYTS
ncbi:CDP-glucose 4,6-dehydratase [Leptospira sp. 201903075]|uniref:CDP-glucose 4,6-dehydratase n=1 Tax=Leptospira chreensis TaxID=2810035 RepID=UPI0019643330|nr:CDP-glucose 4,6-dehydratase [Leptospira chreensis]MBM9589054.1 CDP-glucose 4,6-dehydratase [Leptospira chreensis]